MTSTPAKLSFPLHGSIGGGYLVRDNQTTLGGIFAQDVTVITKADEYLRDGLLCTSKGETEKHLKKLIEVVLSTRNGYNDAIASEDKERARWYTDRLSDVFKIFVGLLDRVVYCDDGGEYVNQLAEVLAGMGANASFANILDYDQYTKKAADLSMMNNPIRKPDDFTDYPTVTPELVQQILKKHIQSCVFNSFHTMARGEEWKKFFEKTILHSYVSERVQEITKNAYRLLIYGPKGVGRGTLVESMVAYLMEAKIPVAYFRVTASGFRTFNAGKVYPTLDALFYVARTYAEGGYPGSKQAVIIYIDQVHDLITPQDTGLLEALRSHIAEVDRYPNIFTIVSTESIGALPEYFITFFNRKIFIPLPSMSDIRQALMIAVSNIGVLQSGLPSIDISRREYIKPEDVSSITNEERIKNSWFLVRWVRRFMTQQSPGSYIMKDSIDLIASYYYQNMVSQTEITRQIDDMIKMSVSRLQQIFDSFIGEDPRVVNALPDSMKTESDYIIYLIVRGEVKQRPTYKACNIKTTVKTSLVPLLLADGNGKPFSSSVLKNHGVPQTVIEYATELIANRFTVSLDGKEIPLDSYKTGDGIDAQCNRFLLVKRTRYTTSKPEASRTGESFRYTFEPLKIQTKEHKDFFKPDPNDPERPSFEWSDIPSGHASQVKQWVDGITKYYDGFPIFIHSDWKVLNFGFRVNGNPDPETYSKIKQIYESMIYVLNVPKSGVTSIRWMYARLYYLVFKIEQLRKIVFDKTTDAVVFGNVPQKFRSAVSDGTNFNSDTYLGSSGEEVATQDVYGMIASLVLIASTDIMTKYDTEKTAQVDDTKKKILRAFEGFTRDGKFDLKDFFNPEILRDVLSGPNQGNSD